MSKRHPAPYAESTDTERLAAIAFDTDKARRNLSPLQHAADAAVNWTLKRPAGGIVRKAEERNSRRQPHRDGSPFAGIDRAGKHNR